MNQKRSLIMAAVLAGECACRAALTTYYWNCESASPTSGSNPNITAGSFARVNGGNSSLTDTGSTSSGYTGASGGNNFEALSVNGALLINNSAYFIVTLTPRAGYTITLNSISFGSRSTSTGPTAIALYSSIDNYASAIGSASLSANSTWVLLNPTLGGSLLTSADGTDVSLRIYGYNGSGAISSPNWRIDDISFTVSSLEVVPEIEATGAISGAGLLAQCGVRIWRQRRQGIAGAR